MLLVIKQLREIVECIRSGAELPEELADWLEQSLREFLDHRCGSVDEALGLRFAKGGVPWWLEEAMRVRDAALRTLADRFLAHESVSGRAAQIHALSVRFAAANWQLDRCAAAMPDRYLGTPREFLWHAFKSGAPMPLGERRLRSILVGLPDPPRDGAEDAGPRGAPARIARFG